MHKATIRTKKGLKKFACFHKYFDARNFEDVPKPYEDGIKIYRVCAKCGKIKKHYFIKRNMFKRFHVSDYPFFMVYTNKVVIIQGDINE